MNRKQRAKQQKKNERAKKIAARQDRERRERTVAEQAELDRAIQEQIVSESHEDGDELVEMPYDGERAALDWSFEEKRVEAEGGRSREEIEELLQGYDEERWDTVRDARLLDARELAQETAFQALEESDPAARIQLARTALGIHPGCVEAASLLALETGETSGFNQIADAARRTLDAAPAVDEPWWDPQRRPFLRALAAWVEILDREGSHRAARGVDDELMRRSPSDGTNACWRIVRRHLHAGDRAAAAAEIERLFEAGFEDDPVLHALAALECALAEDWPAAAGGIAAAMEALPDLPFHIESEAEPDWRPVDADEIACEFIARAWREHPKALAWMLDALRPVD